MYVLKSICCELKPGHYYPEIKDTFLPQKRQKNTRDRLTCYVIDFASSLDRTGGLKFRSRW